MAYSYQLKISNRSGLVTFICPKCGQIYVCNDIKQIIKVSTKSDDAYIEIRPKADKVEDCVEIVCCDCGVDMVCAPKSMVSIVMSAHRADVKIEKFDLGNAWLATGERFVKYSPNIIFAVLKEDCSKFHNTMTETFAEEGKRVEILEMGRSESRIFAEIRPIVDFEIIDSIEAMIVEFDAFWKNIEKGLEKYPYAK